MFNTIKTKLNTIQSFVVLSFSITAIILTLYISQTNMPMTVIGYLYLFTIPTYYYFAALILTLLTLPFLFIPKLSYLVIVPKSLLDIFLLFNFFVFKVYKFHIDNLFINMAIHDSKGLGLSTFILGIGSIVIVSVFAANFVFFNKAKKSSTAWPYKAGLFIFCLIAFNQATHAWGHYFKQRELISFTPYFPYFLPATSTKKMQALEKSHPYIVPKDDKNDNEGSFNLAKLKQDDLFIYPSKDITTQAASEKAPPNVLLLVIESWRMDMLNSTVTPNIHQYSQNNYIFNNHFSGGNVTVSGLYSLFYGIDSTNMLATQSAPRKYQSIFLKTLKSLGYSTGVYSSNNMDRFTMKEMFFGDIAPKDYLLQLNASPIENDNRVINDFILSFDDENAGQPWFKFLFLASSHHSYHYPDDYKKFKPTPLNPEGFIFNQNTDPTPYLNDYKNSLHYIDSLFSKVKEQLDKIDKNTIIIITGDHGEEFNDNQGYWGHGSNFTRYQTSVPLIISMPDNKVRIEVNRRSSHVDVVPTILRKIGITNDISDYSSGHDLFNLPKKRNLIFSSYKDKAYLIEDTIYSSGLFMDSYHVDDVNNKNIKYHIKQLNKMKNQEVMFFK